RRLAALRRPLLERVLGERVGVADDERSIVDLPARVEREEADRRVLGEERQVSAPLPLHAHQGHGVADAVLERRRPLLLRARPGLERPVAAAGVELVLDADADGL